MATGQARRFMYKKDNAFLHSFIDIDLGIASLHSARFSLTHGFIAHLTISVLQRSVSDAVINNYCIPGSRIPTDFTWKPTVSFQLQISVQYASF